MKELIINYKDSDGNPGSMRAVSEKEAESIKASFKAQGCTDFTISALAGEAEDATPPTTWEDEVLLWSFYCDKLTADEVRQKLFPIIAKQISEAYSKGYKQGLTDEGVLRGNHSPKGSDMPNEEVNTFDLMERLDTARRLTILKHEDEFMMNFVRLSERPEGENDAAKDDSLRSLMQLLERIGTDSPSPIFKSLTLHSDRKNGLISSADGRTVDMDEVGRWCAKARTQDKLPDGKWRKICAWGHTPEEALTDLLKAISDDQREESVANHY